MTSPDNMKDYFDSLAADWQDFSEDEPVRQRIAKRAGFPEGAYIADIGCGRGVMLPHLLANNPREIVANDLSPEMIRYAQQKHTDSRIRFVAGDLFGLSLSELDGAMLFNCYPHFLDKSALAHELARAIKPGGILVIAHSRARQVINGRHRDGLVFTLSTPLREAYAEAAEFAEHFSISEIDDTPELYFIRLVRKES